MSRPFLALEDLLEGELTGQLNFLGRQLAVLRDQGRAANIVGNFREGSLVDLDPDCSFLARSELKSRKLLTCTTSY